MRPSTLTPTVLALVLTLGSSWFCTGSTEASDRTGVYALIDEVKLLPDENAPERVKVYGVFVTAPRDGQGPRTPYEPPAPGHLYLSAPSPEKLEACRAEWKDLARVAGRKEIVAFGERYGEVPVVRPPLPDGVRRRERGPDPHPLAGVRKVTELEAHPAQMLRYALVPVSPLHTVRHEDEYAWKKPDLVVRNCFVRGAQVRYIFTLYHVGGEHVASGAVEPGENETRWTPAFWLQPGERYVWTAQAIDPGRPGAVFPVTRVELETVLAPASPPSPSGDGGR